MKIIQAYQKYIYAVVIVLFFTTYLGYSLTSGETVKPNNPYENKNEEVSKVTLRDGFDEIIETADKDTENIKPDEPREEPEPEKPREESEPEKPIEEPESEEPTEEQEPEEPIEEPEPEEPIEEPEPEEPIEELEPEEPIEEPEPEEPIEEPEPEEPIEEPEPEEPIEEPEPEEPIEEPEPEEPIEEPEPEEPIEEPEPENPGGENPGGENPGGENPGGENPGGENPGGENPGGENPGGENPGGENPGGENPGGENPGGENPGGENPGGENPGGENPGGENPGGEKPPIIKPIKDDYLGVVLKGKNTEVKKNDTVQVLNNTKEVVFSINKPGSHFAYEDYLEYIKYIEDKNKLSLGSSLFVSYKVTANGKKVELDDNNDFEVSLSNGFNRIKVELVLKDANGNLIDGKSVHDTKTFTVKYQDKKDLIIYTDLKDNMTVHNEQLSFIAYAKLAGKKLSNKDHLKVTINGKTIEAEENGNTYNQTLQQGENTIEIVAIYEGIEKKATYKVMYNEHLFKFDDQPNSLLTKVVLTNDENRIEKVIVHSTYYTLIEKLEVSGSDRLEFLAGNSEVKSSYLKVGRDFEKLNRSVKLTLIEDRHIHARYTVTVITKTGESETRIFMKHAKNIDKNLLNGRIDITNNPTLNLTKNTTTKNSMLSLVVKSYDREDTQLRVGSEKVLLNGRLVLQETGKENADSANYILGKDFHMEPGVNDLEIIVRDSTGHQTKQSYTINYTKPEDGDVIGTVKISLEAGTLGYGTIASNGSMNIIHGEPASALVDRFLKENRISYDSTGNIDADYYLSQVRKNGINTNPQIPKGLLENLAKEDIDVRPDPDDVNELGEFDYTAFSGWMYSVNGSYPNIGFSSFYFEDGDEVRIRFTLALGADIGNANNPLNGTPESPAIPDLGDW